MPNYAIFLLDHLVSLLSLIGRYDAASHSSSVYNQWYPREHSEAFCRYIVQRRELCGQVQHSQPEYAIENMQYTGDSLGVICRCQDAGDRIMSELEAIQPNAETHFILKELIFLRNAHDVCYEII